MATIEIQRNHSLTVEDMKTKAEELVKDLEKQELGITWKWEGDNIRLDAPSGSAKGTKGLLVITKTDVKVDVDLPLLLRILKGKIQGKIEAKLDKLLSQTT